MSKCWKTITAAQSVALFAHLIDELNRHFTIKQTHQASDASTLFAN